jgi:processive 1,2-diacylglycerol beta-glucosyltransferase
MNTLILTGRFGMGHISAAEAVRQEILTWDPEASVYIVDVIDYIFPRINTLIYKSFNFMVGKCAYVYNILNDIAAKHNGVPLKKKAAKKVSALLDMYRPERIIATLPACSQYISAYKELTGTDIPLYTCVTDLTVHEEWLAPKTDLYFVGAECTKREMVAKGVLPEKIVVSGIPVRQDFKSAADILKTDDRKEVLIMGGGLGLIPQADDLLQTLCQIQDIHVTVITGKNTSLLQKVQDRFPEIEAVGYTEYVPNYMRRADLLVTKSGGITTFEALHCGTPLYIIKPFLMQEVGNALYIEQQEIGRVAWKKSIDIATDICALLRDGAALAAMRENMRRTRVQLATANPFKKEAAAC